MDNIYTPAYVAIAAKLRADITEGRLEHGAKLPSVRELAEEFKVSSITARSAISALRTEGLVITQKGKGAYVRSERPMVRIAPDRYLPLHKQAAYVQEAERAGRELNVQHTTTVVNANYDVAERLGIETEDEVSLTRYQIAMDSDPVSFSSTYEPLYLTRNTRIEDPQEGDYANLGTVARFASIGHHITRVVERPNPRIPSEVEAQRLAIPNTSPVVEIIQTFHAGEVPVQTATIVFAASRYELVYDMELKW